MSAEEKEVSFRERLILQHRNTLTNLDQFVKVMAGQLASGVTHIITVLKQVVNNQGMELIILRELEEGIRKQLLTPETMKLLLDELVDLRQKMQAEAKAAAADAALKKE